MKFDEPFHSNAGNRSVMIGGKPPEMVKSDLEAGVARLGGFWRHPNYFESYLYSASVLIEQGRATGTLDEIGLPGFYLQRHSIELLLKELLGWLTSISELRNQLGRSVSKPSNDLLRDMRRSHDLVDLYGHVIELADMLNLSPPPDELGSLISEMETLEITETWSRYRSSSRKRENSSAPLHVDHIPHEVVIPIVEFQERLDTIACLTSSREAFGDTYEDELQEVWSELNAAIENY
jgi:hypothetical protein